MSSTVKMPGVTCRAKRRIALTDLPTIALIRRIVHDKDRDALDELVHFRTLCLLGNGKRAGIGEFILALHRKAFERKARHVASEAIDLAYDMTVDKFTALPAAGLNANHNDGERQESPRVGITCIPYYTAVLRRCEAINEESNSELAEDVKVCHQLQRFIVWHFHLSLKEGVRAVDQEMHRYSWRVNGHSVSLYMPRYMMGSQKRTWLEEHIDAADLSRPGERARIQQIIDSQLPKHPAGPLEAGDYGIGSYSLHTWPPPNLDEALERGLVEVLAEEKASAIDTLRPSIRRLGRERLKDLIRDIFDALGQNQYLGQALAAKYQLSPAAMCRFGGSRWTIADRDTEKPVPDLWRNLASLLAGSESFREAAGRAGVWDAVMKLNQKDPANPEDGTAKGARYE